MVFSCDIVYDAVLVQALMQPRSSKLLQEFVKDECRELLLDYGDNNPLVRKYREDCIKWENAFKASQVLVLFLISGILISVRTNDSTAVHLVTSKIPLEVLRTSSNGNNHMKCILLQHMFDAQEELRTTRENHAIEIRALNERLVLQMKDAMDQMNALHKSYVSSSGKMSSQLAE